MALLQTTDSESGRDTPIGRRRRNQLLEAAGRVFAESGEAGRLEDVATEAGIAKSVIFRHWPSKDALVAEVRLRTIERYRGWVEHACWVADDPLGGVAEAAVGFFGRSGNVLFDPLLARGALGDAAPELDALAPLVDATVARIAPEGAEAMVQALVEGVVLGTLRGWLATPGLADLDLPAPELAGALGLIVSGGLAGLRPLTPPGRRPRRPSRAPLVEARTDRARREAPLLDAALAVFAAAGYEGARLEDIAGRTGTTASALFTYWSGKEELFLRVRQEVTLQLGARILGAIVPGRSPEEQLRAAVRAHIATHYEHPEFQPILLPVPGLPAEVELQSAGWQLTITQVRSLTQLDDVGDLLPVVTAIGLSVLRATVAAMHRASAHPALAAAVAEDYLASGMTRLARSLGVAFDEAPLPG
jgi:AcrR family transcriptional regulator